MRIRRLHHRAAATVALLAALVLTLGGWTATAWAAPQHAMSAQSAPALPALHIANKLVLPQTSIDGPALSSQVGTDEGKPYSQSVLAYTGTDAAHRLNVMTSEDGLHFGNKRTFKESSPFRPDVTQLSIPAGGNIFLAWTGTDANHSLNVLFDYSSSEQRKLTLRESSLSAPAIFLTGNTLLLAWTGTDANHSLNIMSIDWSSPQLKAGHKTVLSQFSSDAGPHLSSSSHGLVLNWTSRTHQLRLATSTDNVHFSSVALPAESSAFAPHTNFTTPGPLTVDWLAWTGTDSAHHLNLRFAFNFGQFVGGKNVLSETAIGGPALAFNPSFQLAWTGTDSAHHLNIMQFTLQ